MIQTVWKHVIAVQEISDCVTFECPEGSEVLSVGIQDGKLGVWYRCDPSNPKRERKLRIAGTGHEWPCDLGRFISTVIMLDGKLVLHIFDEGEVV